MTTTEPTPIRSIMTVCLGNICRSPAAESILQAKFTEAGLGPDRLRITSAGTADYHIGSEPHELTVEVGTERGYEFTSTAAQFTTELGENTDLILAMDEQNVANIFAALGGAEHPAAQKVILMGAFAPGVETADDIQIVADPYGYPRPIFEKMYEQLEILADGVVAAVQNPAELDRIMTNFRAVNQFTSRS